MYHATLRMTDAEDFAFRYSILETNGTVPTDFPAMVHLLVVSQDDAAVFTLTEGEGDGLTTIDASGSVDVYKSAATHGLTPGRYDVGCTYTSGTLVKQPFVGTLVVSEGNLP